ncbi:c-Myc-binding protein homolog [Leptinotarsa decemlineata]|uniref:c-Myc-binding protein homolog n=1 Tax=Leptinotarsa decemlineata TaxID=7539 RepID=UPI000C25293C|nr:c-Myc-binding protein homolog [Leptinotarsa decemlineata]
MTTNQTFKPSEGKREEFRKYLEKNGIMDALTKVLVNLYEEVDKPEDALQYIIDKLSIQAGLDTQKQLISKLENANNQVKSLEEQLEQLKLEHSEHLTEAMDGGLETKEGENVPDPDDGHGQPNEIE